MEPSTAASLDRPRADWARAAEGIQLAGIALFLLLNTTGYLPWSFWIDAFSLWPVLVMSAGLKIAFEKSRAPWLLLLGPVLVLGSLTWLASGVRPEPALAGPWDAQSVARPEGTRRVNFDAALTASRLRLTSDAQQGPSAVEGRATGVDRHVRLTAELDGDTAQVRLHSGPQDGLRFLPGHRQAWELHVPAELPLSFRVRGAGVSAHLDLTRGRPRGGQLDGVFIRVVARLPAPEEPASLHVRGVFNALALSVPEGTPVRVHGPSLPLNAIGRGVRGVEGRPGYDVHVEGVFSSVEVTTTPAAADAPPAAWPRTSGERPKAEAEPASGETPRPQ